MYSSSLLLESANLTSPQSDFIFPEDIRPEVEKFSIKMKLLMFVGVRSSAETSFLYLQLMFHQSPRFQPSTMTNGDSFMKMKISWLATLFHWLSLMCPDTVTF
ncbi:hypothetical protein A3K63_05135 [Candidatus Micrarchaeota archaeon RBG_16_49_10]|nr:MAG: hypothetical protein A3K63_05135 [Candidatus Micrarchaeota archaeon RBG_16_49_10]